MSDDTKLLEEINKLKDLRDIFVINKNVMFNLVDELRKELTEFRGVIANMLKRESEKLTSKDVNRQVCKDCGGENFRIILTGNFLSIFCMTDGKCLFAGTIKLLL